MSATLRTYLEYKLSGEDLLGDVPKHWGVRRIKSVLEEPLRYGANETGVDFSPSLPRYIRITDIRDDNTLRTETAKSLPWDVAGPYLLKDGDLLFARSGATAGKTFLYRSKWGDSAFAGYLIRARFGAQVYPQFLKFFSETDAYWSNIRSSAIQATIENVNAEKYSQMLVPCPPYTEQVAIANFLDAMDERINRYIAAKRRMIQLLEEKKQAVINQAVTRGLDPDVPLKPSGVDWLGDIPAHWEVLRIRALVDNSVTGLWGDEPDESNGRDVIRCIRVADFDMRDLSVSEAKATYRSIAASARIPRLLQEGDILIEKSGGGDNQPVGRVVMFKGTEASVTSNFVSRLRPKKSNAASFFLLYLLDLLQRRRVNIPSIKQTTGIQNLDQRDYLSNLIAVPPLEEQFNILETVRRAILTVNLAIDANKQNISLLLEYRRRLISDVVTGKLDVRGVELPELDDAFAVKLDVLGVTSGTEDDVDAEH